MNWTIDTNMDKKEGVSVGYGGGSTSNRYATGPQNQYLQQSNVKCCKKNCYNYNIFVFYKIVFYFVLCGL